MQVNITTSLKDQFRDSVPNPRDKKRVADRFTAFQFSLINCNSHVM
jgi:hypothetical protein